MVNYRRNAVTGGSYFFTATVFDRRTRLLTDHIGELRAAFQRIQKARPFRIDAVIVLPEHLHTVWTLPPDDMDYPGRWQGIKAAFTRYLKRAGVAVPMRDDGSARLWQRRYWEHTIRDTADLQRHVDYIHFNPVKHGWVARAADWPYSSFHRYVRDGIYPENWGGGEAWNLTEDAADFGE